MVAADSAGQPDVGPLIAELDTRWAQAGYGPHDRRKMALQVTVDLLAALASGADPRRVLNPDVAAVAQRAAAQRTVQPVRVEAARLAAGIIVGATFALVASRLAYPWAHNYLTDQLRLRDRHPAGKPLLLALTTVAASCLGALLGVQAALLRRPAGWATTRRAVAMLPVGLLGAGLAAAGIGTAISRSLISLQDASGDFLVALAGCLAATLCARRAALLKARVRLQRP